MIPVEHIEINFCWKHQLVVAPIGLVGLFLGENLFFFQVETHAGGQAVRRFCKALWLQGVWIINMAVFLGQWRKHKKFGARIHVLPKLSTKFCFITWSNAGIIKCHPFLAGRIKLDVVTLRDFPFFLFQSLGSCHRMTPVTINNPYPNLFQTGEKKNKTFANSHRRWRTMCGQRIAEQAKRPNVALGQYLGRKLAGSFDAWFRSS